MFVEAFMKTGIRYQQRKEGTERSQQQMQSNLFGSKATGLLYSSFCNLLDEK